MSNTPSFEMAARTGLYERSHLTAPEDIACADFLEKLACLLPANPADHIIPRDLRDLCAGAADVKPGEAMGPSFAAAFDRLAEQAKSATYLDGNHNICLGMDAHSKLLDGFVAFHGAQTELRQTPAGAAYFAMRLRARQVYWDMGGNVAPVSYQPTIYR